MKTLILTPTYNEKDNIRILIREVFGYVDKNIHFRIIDDSSPDGTEEVIEKMMKKEKRLQLVKRPGKQGFASAYLEQIKKEKERKVYDVIITMDADLSHKPCYLPKMFELLKRYDLVIGSRYLKEGGIKNWNFKRRMLSKYGNLYVRNIYDIRIKDCSTGFMGFRVQALLDIHLDRMRSRGYAFLSEFKYHFYLAKKKIIEMPIIFEERRHGVSKISKNIIYEGLMLPLILRSGIRKLYRKSRKTKELYCFRPFRT